MRILRFVEFCDHSARQSGHAGIIHRIGMNRKIGIPVKYFLQIAQILNYENLMVGAILILQAVLFSPSYPGKIDTDDGDLSF